MTANDDTNFYDYLDKKYILNHRTYYTVAKQRIKKQNTDVLLHTCEKEERSAIQPELCVRIPHAVDYMQDVFEKWVIRREEAQIGTSSSRPGGNDLGYPKSTQNAVGNIAKPGGYIDNIHLNTVFTSIAFNRRVRRHNGTQIGNLSITGFIDTRPIGVDNPMTSIHPQVFAEICVKRN